MMGDGVGSKVALGVRPRRRLWSVRSVVSMGFLCSLSVVLGTALSFNLMPFGGTYTIKLAVNLLPIQLAGLCYGPLAGFIVGIIADFLKWAIAPVGFYHPGIGIDMGLVGVIVPIIIKLLQHKRISLAHEPDGDSLLNVTIWQVLPAIMVSQVVCSMFLNSYWIASMQHVSILVNLPIRAITAAVMIPVYSFLLRACAKLVPRFGLL